VILPILEPDLHKPAGVPCRHLAAKGCTIYGKPEWPRVCRGYFCEWRKLPWFNGKSLYRPDRLGVLFKGNHAVLACFETRAGALDSPQFHYIKAKIAQGRLVELYPFGVLDGVGEGLTAADKDHGTIALDPETHGWTMVSDDEMRVYRKDGRVPLPLVG
jgi:hypothetical protein